MRRNKQTLGLLTTVGIELYKGKVAKLLKRLEHRKWKRRKSFDQPTVVQQNWVEKKEKQKKKKV